jgi:hypothetical protein
MFKREHLPKELDTIIDKYNFFVEHVKAAMTVTEKATLNKILKTVESNIQLELSQEDKKLIMTIVKHIFNLQKLDNR